MDVFPNAKVLLTVRDPESWYKSVKETIYQGNEEGKKFPMNIMRALSGMKRRGAMVQKLARKPKKGYLTLTNSFKNTFNALDIIQEQSKISKSQTPSRSRATYKAPASL